MEVICSALSTEHGPDMMITSGLPTTTSADLHQRSRLAKLVRHQLVGLQHRGDRFHPRDGRQRLLANDILRPDDADDHAHRARGRPRF